mmetsp:Transcript_10952/g.21757  ORF Transcript_10952/g.21757 Transcript_10952/m.21757 type:complete len:370 (+) Transcript_10952:143-1252(+)
MLSRVTIWVAMFIVAVWVIIENYLIIYQDEVSLDDDMHYVKTRQRQGLEDVCQREDENRKSKYPTLTSTSSHTSSFSSIQNATVIELITQSQSVRPRFNATLIVFFHVPKTGGTSIQYNFNKLQGVNYHFAPGRGRYNQIKKSIDKWLQQTRHSSDGEVEFVEFHAGSCPSFMQLHQQVASWRKTAEAKGINFFSFTLVREPISFAFSVYNDLCVMRGQCGGGLNAFIEMDWVNKQTQFFNTGWSKFIQGRRRSNRTEDMGPSESEAALLFTKMKSILDWVGPSECLVNDTIPLLKYYIPSIDVDNFSSSNVVKKDLDGILYKSMLSHNELDYLHSIMRLDTMLYQNVINHYGSSCFACASPVSSFSGP